MDKFFDENQNNQMTAEGVNMTEVEARIKALDKEIVNYQEAIADAEGALDSAEKELNEVLSELPY